MSIAGSAPVLTEEIGGEPRRLLLRNAEIERFETQHGMGIFELWDQLCGRGPAPQLRHIRDLIALSMVGGGMMDRAADAVMAGVGLDCALELRATAQRVLGVAFLPSILDPDAGKKKAGSSRAKKSA